MQEKQLLSESSIKLLHPTEVTYFFCGEDFNRKHIQNIGYLPEERGLYKSMKVGEQCLYLAQLKGLSKNEAKQKIHLWFKKLDMIDWLYKKVEELSKGMAQKVQFVSTIIHQPKLIILDEPFTGFDPINTEIIKNEIHTLKKKRKHYCFIYSQNGICRRTM